MAKTNSKSSSRCRRNSSLDLGFLGTRPTPEDELREAIRKNDVLKMQLAREKEDFERQIARMKEDMAMQASRLEQDLEDARTARDKFRELAATKQKNADKANGRCGELQKKLNVSLAELAKLRGQAVAKPTTAHEVRTQVAKAAKLVSPVMIKTEARSPSPDISHRKRRVIYHPESSTDEEDANPKRRKVDNPLSASSTTATSSQRRESVNYSENTGRDKGTLVEKAKGQKPKKQSEARTTRSGKPYSEPQSVPAVISAAASAEPRLTLQQRVADVATFVVWVSGRTSPFGVSLAFLTATYNLRGNIFTKIQPEINVPRGTVRHVISPWPKANPGLPPYPGAPGTILTNRCDIFDCGPVSLLMTTGGRTGPWIYFGNYELARSIQPLTAAEARELDFSTKAAWAHTLAKIGNDFSHAELHVRLWLRKIGQEASEAAVAHHLELLRTKKSPINLSENDVMDALRSWKETLHVVTIRCVGYDHHFLADIETRWRKWQANGSKP